MICGTKLIDIVPIKELLDRANMLSVNQINAQVKLTEMWKASNFQNYPLNIEKYQPVVNGRVTRGASHEKLVEPPTLNTFIGNATRLWNKVPESIRNAKSISTAKKEMNCTANLYQSNLTLISCHCHS